MVTIGKIAVLAAILSGVPNAYSQLPDAPEPSSSINSEAKTTPQPDNSIVLGRPLEVVRPKIPKNLRRKNLMAAFSATLTTTGIFIDVAFIGGDPELKDLGVDAINHWRYTPCVIHDRFVDTNVYVIISSDHGKVGTDIGEDPPFPTKPQQPIEDQISAGELFRIDPGQVEAPRTIYDPDPEYSDLARKTKFQATVVLGVIVGADGNVKDVWVTKRGGLGLDQKSVDTVRQWKFRPGTKNGVPVNVLSQVETQFRIY